MSWMALWPLLPPTYLPCSLVVGGPLAPPRKRPEQAEQSVLAPLGPGPWLGLGLGLGLGLELGLGPCARARRPGAVSAAREARRGEAWRGVASPRPCGLLVPRFPSMALLTYLLWLYLLWRALPEVSS